MKRPLKLFDGTDPAQMNNALVKTIESQLAQKAFKKMTNQKSTRWNHNFRLHNQWKYHFPHLEEFTRRHINRNNIKTSSFLSPPIKNTTTVIENFIVDDVRFIEQNTTYSIVVGRHKNSNKTILKGKPPFLKFRENV